MPAELEPVARCSTCAAFAPMPNGDGQCRMYPPQVIAIPGAQQPIAYFPYVKRTWWCLEHEPIGDE